MSVWDKPARVTQRKIVLKPGQFAKGERPIVCVKCGVVVEPGLAYTGKVLESHSTVVREKAVFLAASLEYTVKEIRIPVVRYIRGFICDECAGDYHYSTFTRGGVSQSAPIVVVDAKVNVKLGDAKIGGKSQKGFNTRVVRVKH